MYPGMEYMGNSEYKVHWYHNYAPTIHKFRLAYKQVKVRVDLDDNKQGHISIQM